MKSPEFNKDGYPTNNTLDIVKNWKIRNQQDYDNLIEFLKNGWTYPEYFGNIVIDEDHGECICISTAGWSGNESFISALEENCMFWAIGWVESRRGGHYKFKKNVIK